MTNPVSRNYYEDVVSSFDRLTGYRYAVGHQGSPSPSSSLFLLVPDRMKCALRVNTVQSGTKEREVRKEKGVLLLCRRILHNV